MNRVNEIKLYPAKNVPIHMEKLFPMWKAYMLEIGEAGTEEELFEELMCRLKISETNENIFFDTVWSGGDAIGFAFYSVDGGIRNVIPPGYGYIMEFYITPQWRRRNIGVRCIRKIEEKLKDKDCPKIYLTSVEESEEFWRRVGFIKSELVDPDNHLNIWFK